MKMAGPRHLHISLSPAEILSSRLLQKALSTAPLTYECPRDPAAFEDEEELDEADKTALREEVTRR